MFHGANLPYDVDPSKLEQTFALLRLLDPTEILITSHAAVEMYERLADELPQIQRWHVRLKVGPWRDQGPPSNALEYREWPSERSPSDAIEWLLGRGLTPWVLLGNEPDIELAREPVDEPRNRARAIDRYCEWASATTQELNSRFPATPWALAPLSQGGPPERFGD